MQARTEHGLGHIGFHLFHAEREHYKVHDPTKKIFEAKYQNGATGACLRSLAMIRAHFDGLQ